MYNEVETLSEKARTVVYTIGAHQISAERWMNAAIKLYLCEYVNLFLNHS